MKISLNLAVATLVIIAAVAVQTSGSVIRTPAGAIQKENLKRKSLESLESKLMNSKQFADLKKRNEEIESTSELGTRTGNKEKRRLVRKKKEFISLGIVLGLGVAAVFGVVVIILITAC